MRPRFRPVFLALGLTLACQPSQTETSGFTTKPAMTTTPASTSDAMQGDTSSSSGGQSGSTSAASTTSTTNSDTSAGGSNTTLILDVGSDKDVGDATPPGCKGKIDFLFVISRGANMQSSQAKLIAAFPKFIETIESKFADFDFHIMVIDGDTEWGLEPCDADCQMQGSCEVPDYPCDLLGLVTTCDRTIGAGNVFAAGANAMNQPCTIAGGRRYLTKEQPNLSETFSCIAKLGVSGRDLLGEALTMAMKPEINAPGGCNAGFLRDDALLMVTFIGGYDDGSKWDPGTWAANVLKAKKGDYGAAVMLSILDPKCPPYDRICELVEKFPYHLVADSQLEDHAAAFDAATDLIEAACAEYIPG